MRNGRAADNADNADQTGENWTELQDEAGLEFRIVYILLSCQHSSDRLLS